MPIGVIIVRESEVFGVPGNVTQDVSFAPNLLISREPN